MNDKRSVLVLLQAASLVIVPILLEISWSREIFKAYESETFLSNSQSLSKHKSAANETLEILSKNYSFSSSNWKDENLEKNESRPLQIAWLMSFPNSGTSYTSHFIREATRTKTATNYAELRLSREVLWGIETKESIPVFDDQPTGPFWTDGNEIQPTSGYVLTKTHCGALCMWCKPEKYTQMIHHFKHRCLRSDKMKVLNGTKTITKSMYPPMRVKKAVHLIRNPLDNVVSRFRYERTNGRSALAYNSTKEDFRTYCDKMNKEFLSDLKSGRYIQPEVRKIIEEVPCHAEIMKWVEWHNMAFIVTRDMEIKTLVLHYEDYSLRFDEVTSTLLAFLELEAIAEPPAFQAFKEYKDYYTQEERDAVAMAIRFMALKETWDHISRYFP